MKCKCGGTMKFEGAEPATTGTPEVRHWKCDRCGARETAWLWYTLSSSTSTSWSRVLSPPSF